MIAFFVVKWLQLRIQNGDRTVYYHLASVFSLANDSYCEQYFTVNIWKTDHPLSIDDFTCSSMWPMCEACSVWLWLQRPFPSTDELVSLASFGPESCLNLINFYLSLISNYTKGMRWCERSFFLPSITQSLIIHRKFSQLFVWILISEAAGELGWTFTLIVVSIISALLGAIIMVIVLRCKR